MKILCLEVDGPAPVADIEPDLLEREARAVWELHKIGFLREAYFRADEHRAVLVVEAADTTTARARLRSLPLVESGSIEFELVPLVAYDGYERAFRDAT